MPGAHTHVTISNLAGTDITPEYYRTLGRVHIYKCDIYSFRVLVMKKHPSDEFFQHINEM